MPDFETTSMSEAQIEVTHVASGHAFVFTVVLPAIGGRALSLVVQAREYQPSDIAMNDIIGQARSYAEAEMISAGNIDRTAL